MSPLSPAPLTPLSWLEAWSLDLPMLCFAALLLLGYLTGVQRARRKGRHWSPSATTWFVAAGIGSLVLVTTSFLGTYARLLFWPLAVQDVLLLTLVPVGLTMGKPVSLWRQGRTRPVRQPGRAMTRLLRLLMFPLVGSLLAMTVLLLIYTTSWDAARLDNPVLLDVTRIALVGTGCLFLWPLLGVDGEAGFATYPVRVLIATVDGLLDAVPGLAVMGKGGLIAGSHYRHVAPIWGGTPMRDQQIGALAMIGLSELVGLPALLLLLVGWVRTDAREAGDLDRSLDARMPDVSGGSGVSSETLPDTRRHTPWWVLEPGPLAERAAREGWPTDPTALPPHPGSPPRLSDREAQ